MKRISIEQEIATLSGRLNDRYEAGDPVAINGNNARADLIIHSLDPLMYQSCERFWQRAPKLIGSFAIESLIWRSRSSSAVVPYAVLPTEWHRVGVRLQLDVLNGITREVDLPTVWRPS